MESHQVTVKFDTGIYLNFGDVGSCYHHTFHLLYVMLKALATFGVADVHYIILKGLNFFLSVSCFKLVNINYSISLEMKDVD